MKAKMLYRNLTFNRKDAVDEEARTVRVAFSSEQPVERWFGDEVLDHRAKSVRMDRMNDGAAVLVQHDHDQIVGVVESAEIDESDRTGRALVRFGNGTLASEVFRDVVDGIRRHISVGYRIHEIVEKTKESLVRVTDWEPYEISFVSVPADATVGVGRAPDGEENTVTIRKTEDKTVSEKETKPAEPAPSLNIEPAGPSEEDKRRWAEQAGKEERERVSGILALARKFDDDEGADKAIADGMTLDAYRASILDGMDKPAALDTDIREKKPISYLGLSDDETRRFSFLNLCRAIDSGKRNAAPFELEVSEALVKQMGRDTEGFFIPWEVQVRHNPILARLMHRAPPMDTSTAGEGAELVGTDHLAGSFIENLYNASVVLQAGATMLPGLVGNVDIPAQAGTAVFNWVAEGADATDSVTPTRKVSLTPRTLSGSVSMTRRLLKQSAPAVDAMVERDLIIGAGLGIDKGALVGAGTDEPTGVINQAGVGTVEVGTTGAPSYAEYVALETAVTADNADISAMRYITDASHIGNAKTTFIDAGSGLRIMNPGSSSINGYDVSRTNSMVGSTGAQFDGVIFGVWSQVLIGMWGVLDVRRDPYTLAASDGLHIRVFQDVDVAVRHAPSFSKTINAV